jgi:hypothetical protein
MKNSIESLIKTFPGDPFNTEEFRNMIEDHLSWLITHPNTRTIAISAHQVDVFDFDWIGLLNDAKIQPDLHWTTIRMNGGTSFTDVPPNLRSLQVPDYTVIQNLIMLNSSTKKIK